MIKVSNERAENEFFSDVIIFLKFEHRWPNEFLTSQLHIVVIHSCVKYVSYECYRTKVETSCFTDLRHLVIIIAINMWLYSNQSRFGFWGTHCITLSSMLKQGRMQDFPIGGAEMSSLPVGGRPPRHLYRGWRRNYLTSNKKNSPQLLMVAAPLQTLWGRKR